MKMLYGAIIGFGKIARTSHMDAYLSPLISDKARIIAAVETDQENRLKSAAEFPGINFYSSVDELFRFAKLDFVDITCPPKYHFDILKQCIDNNVHIICEKPFTLTAEEAEEIRGRIEDTSLILIPCHQYKYSPVWKEFKSFIDSKEIKSNVLMQFNVFRTQADPGLAGLEGYWRTSSSKEGGGILIDTGIHYLYLIRWLLGDPERIYAHQTTLKHSSYNCEDTVVVNYVSQRGLAIVTLTWGADKRHNDARIICNEGSLFYDQGDKIKINIGSDIKLLNVPNASDKSHYSMLYIDLFNDFINAINNNEAHPEWLEEAYQSIRILNNCSISSELEIVVI